VTVEDVDAGLGDLLTFLREQRGVDFTGYKRPSLARRVRRRMEMVDVADLGAYQDLLEAEPDEQSRLVETVLINVTKFFRDDGAWQFLADEIVSKLIDAKGADEPIRVWSAGCASGEEAYTIAMILAETLGIDEFRRRVKIYATDVDDDALGVGRRGSYTTRQLEPVPDELIARYFEPGDDERTFRSDCRRSVIFGRHDITTDAPISRLDLLICRNVLMYLVRETQRGVLSRFHYALGGGYLFPYDRLHLAPIQASGYLDASGAGAYGVQRQCRLLGSGLLLGRSHGARARRQQASS
jgi:two-component system CheB/CheR fusion protein